MSIATYQHIIIVVAVFYTLFKVDGAVGPLYCTRLALGYWMVILCCKQATSRDKTVIGA